MLKIISKGLTLVATLILFAQPSVAEIVSVGKVKGSVDADNKCPGLCAQVEWTGVTLDDQKRCECSTGEMLVTVASNGDCKKACTFKPLLALTGSVITDPQYDDQEGTMDACRCIND